MLLDEKRVILTEEGRSFLRKLRLSKGLPKAFEKRYQTIISWENGRNNATFNLFIDYLKYFNLNLKDLKQKKFLKEISVSIRELVIQKTTKIPKEKHSLLIKDYQRGLSLEKIGKKYGCTASNVFYILKRYDIDMSKHGSGEKYLFPESKYVDYLIDLNFKKEEILPLISSLLFTDGSLYKHKKGFEISYYGTDKELHKIFADLIWYFFKIRPSSYMIGCGRVLRTKYIDKKIANILLKLSPTYKTKPSRKETWEKFLQNNEQPNLDFMKNYDIKVVNEFIRLAMCADGCISVSKGKNKLFFTLILACAHPNLVKEWSNLFNRVEIKNSIVRGSGKTNIGGVKGIEDCIFKFYNLGGFIKKVEVCVRKSPLCGIEKQRILFLATKLLEKHKRINTIPLNFNEFKRLI